MVHRYRFVIAGVLIILVNQAVTFAVSAHVSGALLPSGSARFAAASGSGSVSITSAAGWVDLPGMTKYITIPGGQTADVMVTFCGDAAADSGTQVDVRAMIRDSLASPAGFVLKSDAPLFSSQCATFYKTNVAAGSPAVKIQWHAAGAGYVDMDARSMIVVVNIH